MEALREQIRADLKRRGEEESKRRFEQKVIDAVVNSSQLEYPQVLIESEINELIMEQLQYWRMGPERFPEYLKLIGKTEEQFREELRPVAIKRFTQSMVLGSLSREEKIEVTDAEIDEEIKKYVDKIEEAKKDEMFKVLNRPQGREPLKHSLIRQKTVQRLVEIATSPEKSAETPAPQAEVEKKEE